jgi:hypothetical protein
MSMKRFLRLLVNVFRRDTTASLKFQSRRRLRLKGSKSEMWTTETAIAPLTSNYQKLTKTSTITLGNFKLWKIRTKRRKMNS